MNSFELGPIQKQWIADLRRYPERQIKGQLGRKRGDGSLRLCCLGQGLVTMCEIIGIEPVFRGNILTDNSTESLSNSYQKLGLTGSNGLLIDGSANLKDGSYHSLAAMNDGGITWPEIADYIEANPENVFTEPK